MPDQNSSRDVKALKSLVAFSLAAWSVVFPFRSHQDSHSIWAFVSSRTSNSSPGDFTALECIIEVAGLVIGAVGLIALESTVSVLKFFACVLRLTFGQVEDGFKKVDTWRHLGKDYQQDLLVLESAAIA
jgi:hypothetical protein